MPAETEKLYQAHASGPGPPLPTAGNSSSSRANVGPSSSIDNASSGPSSCSMVRGPMIGAVTPGRESSQASATLAGSWPTSAASFSYASIVSR